MTGSAREPVDRRRRLLEAIGLPEFGRLARLQAVATAAPAAPRDDATAATPAHVPVPVAAVVSPAATALATEPRRSFEPEALTSLELLDAAVRGCRACGLCESRKQAVPGVGHGRAHWMVVGEGPGEQEDAQGEPFVGASGMLLDAMLSAIGLGRQPGPPDRQVYIANAVKCRPPGNRTPSAEELTACQPFLRQQLALVRPRIVLALGRVAAQSLLGSEAPIGRLRGRVHHLQDGTAVVVSYHPAYLLRQPLEKARAWEDLCLASSHLDSEGSR